MNNRRKDCINQFEMGQCEKQCNPQCHGGRGGRGGRGNGFGRRLGRNQMFHLTKGEFGKLSQLKIGQSGKVLSLRCENEALRRRLLDMGITNGVELTIKKIAPLGDPIDIQLRDYELCIRKSDMENIVVEVI